MEGHSGGGVKARITQSNVDDAECEDDKGDGDGGEVERGLKE